jgi:hypothetical protein
LQTWARLLSSARHLKSLPLNLGKEPVQDWVYELPKGWDHGLELVPVLVLVQD